MARDQLTMADLDALVAFLDRAPAPADWPTFYVDGHGWRRVNPYPVTREVETRFVPPHARVLASRTSHRRLWTW